MTCLVKIPRWPCCRCLNDEPAEFEVRDSRNHKLGLYCRKHGEAELAKLASIQPIPNSAPTGRLVGAERGAE